MCYTSYRLHTCSHQTLLLHLRCTLNRVPNGALPCPDQFTHSPRLSPYPCARCSEAEIGGDFDDWVPRSHRVKECIDWDSRAGSTSDGEELEEEENEEEEEEDDDDEGDCGLDEMEWATGDDEEIGVMTDEEMGEFEGFKEEGEVDGKEEKKKGMGEGVKGGYGFRHVAVRAVSEVSKTVRRPRWINGGLMARARNFVPGQAYYSRGYN